MSTQMSNENKPAPLALDRGDERVRHADGMGGMVRAFVSRVRSGDLGMLPVAIGLIVIFCTTLNIASRWIRRGAIILLAVAICVWIDAIPKPNEWRASIKDMAHSILHE